MDTSTLTGALRELQASEYKWKFAIYSAKKSRDGLELEWLLCKMKGIRGWVETLTATLLEKTVAEKSVEAYSPLLSNKESIGALARTDELIRDKMAEILFNIQRGVNCAPEDFVSGAAPKPAGFAFYGERRDAEGSLTGQVLFMRRGNPFISGAKVRLCTSEGDEIVQSVKPLMKFTQTTD